MIPRNLPSLTTDALRNGWDVQVDQGRVTEAHFDHGTKTVAFIWDPTGLVWSSINHAPTPYRQCAALLKNPEGAPE